MLGSMIALVVIAQTGAGASVSPSASLRTNDVARVAAECAPVGLDRGAYLAMLEAMARRDVPGLGRLIGERQGFLLGQDARVEILAVEDGLARVKVLPGWGSSQREGFLGTRWLSPLPRAGEPRVDPKIRALAELKQRREMRTSEEQRILAEAFRAQMTARPETQRAAMKPVPPGGGLVSAPSPLPLIGAFAADNPAAPGLPQTTVPAPAAVATPAVPAPLPAMQPTPPTQPVRKGHACGAPTRSGEPCKRWVVNGQHCYQHGG